MASISSGIADAAKDAGVVLAALSGAAYGCGYLALRARAHALGTDPGFALIDQAYVFAGFRFVLALLFALLVMTGVVFGVWSFGWPDAGGGGGTVGWAVATTAG